MNTLYALLLLITMVLGYPFAAKKLREESPHAAEWLPEALAIMTLVAGLAIAKVTPDEWDMVSIMTTITIFMAMTAIGALLLFHKNKQMVVAIMGCIAVVVIASSLACIYPVVGATADAIERNPQGPANIRYATERHWNEAPGTEHADRN